MEKNENLLKWSPKSQLDAIADELMGIQAAMTDDGNNLMASALRRISKQLHDISEESYKYTKENL